MIAEQSGASQGPLSAFGEIEFDHALVDGEPLGRADPLAVVMTDARGSPRVALGPLDDGGDGFRVTWLADFLRICSELSEAAMLDDSRRDWADIEGLVRHRTPGVEEAREWLVRIVGPDDLRETRLDELLSELSFRPPRPPRGGTHRSELWSRVGRREMCARTAVSQGEPSGGWLAAAFMARAPCDLVPGDCPVTGSTPGVQRDRLSSQVRARAPRAMVAAQG